MTMMLDNVREQNFTLEERKFRGEQTAGGLRGPVDLRGISSGKLAVCYGKWSIEIIRWFAY